MPKLFAVVYEQDGATVKAPGIFETEIKRVTMYYAADDIITVWNETEQLRRDPDINFKEITEVVSSVMVL